MWVSGWSMLLTVQLSVFFELQMLMATSQSVFVAPRNQIWSCHHPRHQCHLCLVECMSCSLFLSWSSLRCFADEFIAVACADGQVRFLHARGVGQLDNVMSVAVSSSPINRFRSCQSMFAVITGDQLESLQLWEFASNYPDLQRSCTLNFGFIIWLFFYALFHSFSFDQICSSRCTSGNVS